MPRFSPDQPELVTNLEVIATFFRDHMDVTVDQFRNFVFERYNDIANKEEWSKDAFTAIRKQIQEVCDRVWGSNNG